MSNAFQEVMPLGFTGQQQMPIDSYLKFTHPVLEPLIVRSGANSIKWSYELNTQSTPTLGGEVVQILSCYVGPITIEGAAYGRQTSQDEDLSRIAGWADFTPTDEMVRIADWFLTYMHAAGGVAGDSAKRDQQAVRFQYPARNWDFYIWITDLQGFDFHSDQVVIPWSITAEIVSDAGLDYFVAATMNTFTEDLTSRTMLAKAISTNYDAASNPFINPALNDPGSSNLANRLGDNFQSLIASWSGGNFMSWGYNPLGDPGDILSADPYSVYSTLLGGEYIGRDIFGDYGGATASGTEVAVNTNANSGASAAGDTTTPAGIVCTIIQAFAAVGIPPELALAAAMNETGSTLSPDTRQQGGDYAMGLFQTFPAGRGGSQSHAAEVKAAFAHKDEPVTKYYPAADQIADAAAWWNDTKKTHGLLLGGQAGDDSLAQFAQFAQGAGDPAYISKIVALLPTARAKVKSANCGSTSTSTVQEAMIAFMNWAEGNPTWSYTFNGTDGRGGRPLIVIGDTNVHTDCSGYAHLIYAYAAFKTNKSLTLPIAQTDSIKSQGVAASTPYQIGDLAVFGFGSGGHVIICRAAGNADTSIWSSNGQTGLPPSHYTGILGGRKDLQAVRRLL